MTTLRQLKTQTDNAKYLYEAALDAKVSLPNTIKERQGELAELQEELDIALGKLSKPLLEYTYKGDPWTKRRKYGSPAAQKVWDLQNRVWFTEQMIEEMTTRLDNIGQEIIDRRREYDLAVSAENLALQIQEAKAAKAKTRQPRTKAPVDTARTIPTLITGKELGEALKGWTKPTGLVDVGGVGIPLETLRTFAETTGKGLLLFSLGELKQDFYRGSNPTPVKYNGPALEVEYEAKGFKGKARVIHTPGDVEYRLAFN